MSRINRRIAPSCAVLMAAAGLAVSPAQAATTTVTVPANTTQTTPITASPAAGDTVIVDVNGTLQGSNPTSVTTNVVQGSGAGAVNIIIDGRVQGRFNFVSATGPITVTNNSGADPLTQGWVTGATTNFGSGGDSIVNAASGVISIQGTATFNFGTGTDSFVNNGRLIIDRTGAAAGTLNLTGLETFNNSGLIVMGSVFNVAGATGMESDGVANDRLAAQGVAYTGSGDSRVLLDVNLGATSQSGCESASQADCLDFRTGSTAGSTLLTVNDISTVDAELGVSLTLVAGSSAAEHFTLDPSSDGYVLRGTGAGLRKGFVIFRMGYDAEAQEHQLVSVLSEDGLLGLGSAAIAQETWRATTGSWLIRQADLRDTPGGLTSSEGLWARVGDRRVERAGVMTRGEDSFATAYDVGYDLDISQVVFGGDILRGSTQRSAWVAGIMAGYVRTNADYAAGGASAGYDGFTGGLYGSYVGGPLFVDAILNANVLEGELEAPGLDLPDDVALDSKIQSYGLHAEAGWRFDVAQSLFVEPLVGFSYVESQLDDIVVPDGSGAYAFEDKNSSFRLGGGLRIGAAKQVGAMKAAFSLAGRYWEEQEAENESVLLLNSGASSVALLDNFGGSFNEMTGSVNLFSGDGRFSGFAQVGALSGDDYDAIDGTLGIRWRW